MNFPSLKSILLKELEYPLANKDQLQSYNGIIGWKGKIVYMSPDKYLRLAAKLPDNAYNQKSLDNIEYRIKNNLPLDPPTLEVDMNKRKVIGHEGRHRATISKKLNIQLIPVLIFTGSNYDRVPKWSIDQHAIVDKSEFLPEKP